MLRDIHIQNFRCFQDTKVSGFGNVNLITGKNNSGKTALLEALYLAVSPRPEQITRLKGFRRESPEFSKMLPEKAWDYFFYNQEKSNTISIQINHGKGNEIHHNIITIFVDEQSVESFFKADIVEGNFQDLLTNSRDKVSPLKLKVCFDDSQIFESSLILAGDSTINKTQNFSDMSRVSLIPASLIRSNYELAVEFDKAKENYREQEVLKGFQIIDPLIRSAETLSIGIPTLYLAREGQKRLPISLFGDAINRVANIILCIIDKVDGVLLIDEIENGIHHANQSEIWRMIFRLAKEFNVQIFATTHSLEMLEAFTKVGLENEEFEQMGTHFEMARKLSSNRIIGIRRDLDILKYSLDHELEVRGE